MDGMTAVNENCGLDVWKSITGLVITETIVVFPSRSSILRRGSRPLQKWSVLLGKIICNLVALPSMIET